MPNQVIKGDGSKQPFDEDKLKRSIAAAVKDTNLTEEQAQGVVEQVFHNVTNAIAGKDEIVASELKESILGELDRVEPSAAESWRAYDRSRGKS